MDLKETVCKDVDWIRVAQDRVKWWHIVDMIINLLVP
jgi:hypothetical protein